MTSTDADAPQVTAAVAEGHAALSMRDIRVERGGRQVLRVAALDVAAGETLALMGPNGSGKSTLLLTAALLIPAAGELRLLGASPRRSGDRVRLRRRTATVFQDASLLDMSVRRNVETALRLHGLPRAERRPRAEHWLRRLGIAHLAEARPHQLSGGEAQRASLARAFAVEPSVLFLDEPFAALDLQTTARLVGEVRELLEQTGCTALLATHDQSEAQLLADRAAVVLDGRIAQLGPVEAVLAAPATPTVARFLGHGVLPAALLDPARSGEASLPPEAVRIADGPGERTASPVTLRGVAGAVGVARGQALVTVDVGAPLPVRLPPELARDLRPGTELELSADLHRVTWHPGAPDTAAGEPTTR